MEGSDYIDEVLAGFSEGAAAWSQFQSNPVTVQHALMEHTVLFELSESWLLPDWMSGVRDAKRFMLMYPVHVNGSEAMCRLHQCMSYTTDALRMAGVKVGKIVEERASIKRDASGQMVVIESGLLDDDTIIYSRHEMLGLNDRQTAMLRTSASDSRVVYQYYKRNFRINCEFCTARREKCVCSKTNMLSGMGEITTAKQPSRFFWDDIRATLQANFFIEFKAPAGSHVLSGPTPASIHVPKIIACRAVRLSAPLQEMLTAHLGTLTSRHVKASPALISDSSFTSDDHAVRAAKGRKAEPSRTQCPTCGQTFSRKFDCRRHMAAVHERKESLECHICHRTFGLRQYLLAHINNVHNRKRTVSCSMCQGELSTAHKMRLHVRRVHGVEYEY